MKALVVNCSAPAYNLGARKLADWLEANGHHVTRENGDPGFLCYGYDLVALSVVFSWDAPIARDIAVRVKDNADVWCGGPGMYALTEHPTPKRPNPAPGWWRRETGLTGCTGTIDPRFDRQAGGYLMTFAARGCDRGCWFCTVPLIEGRVFTYDWDFTPARVLCDNNISAQRVDFQEHVIARYRASGLELRDANSGFEPLTFDEGTFARWEPLLKQTDAPWRFAFDEQKESADVERVCAILSRVRSRRKLVWVLVGNESIASCYDRAMKVLAWGGEPWCQYVLPLDLLTQPYDVDATNRQLQLRADWPHYRLGRDFCRYFNTRLWRTVPIQDYRPRESEPPPFREILRRAA